MPKTTIGERSFSYSDIPLYAHLLPWPTVPEQFVIAEALEQSSALRAFYQLERTKIVEDIYWVEDRSLPRGIDFRRTSLAHRTTGAIVQVIRMRRVPAVGADAMFIAHEVQHFILDTMGYPSLSTSVQFETLASTLASMLHDPIVDMTLRNYDFDLRAVYQAEVEESMCQLQTIPFAPTKPFERLRWMFNYTSKILDWEMLTDSTSGEENAFQTWFDARYPDIAGDTYDLLAFIHSIGYKQPLQQLHLLHAILQRYHLESLMRVICDEQLLKQSAILPPV